jgi:hypothetical protein
VSPARYELGSYIPEDVIFYSHRRRNLKSHMFSSLFSPNTLFSTLFSNTLSLCSSLNVRDQVAQPYRTTGKIIVLCILAFKFFDSRREDRRFWAEW